MNERRKKKIVPVLLIILMIATFISSCGGMSGDSGDNAKEIVGNSDSINVYENSDSIDGSKSSDNSQFSEGKNENQSDDGIADENTAVDNGKDKYQTDPIPEGKPIPIEPQEAVISDKEYSCTISISCATILDNFEELEKEKQPLVPEDGWILEPTTVTFYEGESVFNVLQRTCKQNKIHMEFQNTPVYNSAYIEGINNLYEFDCGNLSGWMYSVNDWFPNYGCSRYQLKDGDIIEWIYTCDLGADIGGSNSL